MFINPAWAEQALSTAALNPLSGQPYDLGLGFHQAWDDMRQRLLSDSAIRLRRDAYARYADELHQLTGQRLDNPILTWKQGLADRLLTGDLQEQRLGEFHDAVAKLAEKHPGRLPVKDRTQMDAELSAKLIEGKQQAEGGVNVGWGDFGRFAGTMAASFTDPVNLGSMALGGIAAPRTAVTSLMTGLQNVGRVAAIEAGVNAVTQAAIEPGVSDFNQRMGIDYGLKDSASAIGLAAVGGAVLGGAGEAAFQGVKPLLARWTAAKAKGLTPTPEQRGAEMALEHQVHQQDSNPFPDEAGDFRHHRAMAETMLSLSRGGVADTKAWSEFDLHRRENMASLAQRAEAIPHRDGLVDDIRFGVLPDAVREKLASDLAVRDGEHPFIPRLIDRQGVRHILNEHSADPVPVMASDVVHFPSVLETGEFVAKTYDKGRPFLTWRKLVDGNWLYVGEEMLGPRHPTMRVKTAYWTPGPKMAKAGTPMDAPASGARFTGSMADGPGANVRNASDGPAEVSVAPPAKKANPGPMPRELVEPARPQTLAGFLARRGLKDEDGWLKHAGLDNKTRVGLLNKDGLTADDAARAAWEDGFFSDFHDRPTPDDLHRALLDELSGGQARIRPDDEAAAQDWLTWKANMDELDRHGIDPRGKSMSEVMRELDARRFRSRPPFSEDDLAHWMAREPGEDIDEAAILADYDRALAEGEDLFLPADGMTDEGAQGLARASDILAEFDREIDAYDAAAFCLGK